MRRDQILKICCNHQITADLELRPMNTSEVAWCWFATDFTDGQPVDEQFALKFKVISLKIVLAFSFLLFFFLNFGGHESFLWGH